MKRYWRREEGQGLVEYALLLVLVAIVVIAILALLGDQLNVVFARVIAALNGQTLTGTGTEYVITGMDAAAAGSAPFCTVTVSNMQVTVFIDGALAGSGTSVSGNVTITGGSGGSTSGTTGSNGSATLTNVSGSGSCTGTATLTVGSSSMGVPYTN
jgi:pilus assembly protein Flp/PilA